MAELGLPRILQSRVSMRRRMAGEGGRRASRSGSADQPEALGRGARGAPRGVHAGWRALALLFALLIAGVAQAQIVASRVWPAKDYTRLTLETPEEIKYQLFAVKDPDRLVLDLETADLSPALAELEGKV